MKNIPTPVWVIVGGLVFYYVVKGELRSLFGRDKAQEYRAHILPYFGAVDAGVVSSSGSIAGAAGKVAAGAVSESVLFNVDLLDDELAGFGGGW